MSSGHALWWLALPVLLLPLWWHRQKRQRTRAEPLATARFLPAAAPQQLRVWQWADKALLLLRLLLLLGLIAWLADGVVPWRGNTVFVGATVNPAWADAQIREAGLGAARRSPLPGGDPLAWLAAHEREWRPDARLAIVATGDAVPMRAHPPVLAHAVELRLQPPALGRAQGGVQGRAQAGGESSAPVAAPITRHVVLASSREGAWRSLLSAFDSAGLGLERHVIQTLPDGQTDLIVWDRPGTPDPAWRAPLWWAVQPGAFPELATARRAGGLRVADTARGRLWAQDRWPVDERDPLAAARALFEYRDGLREDPLPFAAPAMTLPARTAASAASADATTGAGRAPMASNLAPVLAPGLAPLLALLLVLERGLAHRVARRARAPAPVVPAEAPGVAS